MTGTKYLPKQVSGRDTCSSSTCEIVHAGHTLVEERKKEEREREERKERESEGLEGYLSLSKTALVLSENSPVHSPDIR